MNRAGSLLVRAWQRIHEPRVIAVLYFAAYAGLLLAGTYALINPPSSVEGEVGTFAMYLLAGLLTFGASVGVAAVLPGIYWLERTAVLSIALASGLYLLIVITLHIQGTGNRLLQAGFIGFVLLMQGVRWERIRIRPYEPSRTVTAP